MTTGSYVEECRQLIQAFEKTQYIMLCLDKETAVAEFFMEIKQIRAVIEPMFSRLQSKKFSNKIEQTLLIKQIERLLKFLKEMESQIHVFKQDRNLEDKQIIFYFDRQHLFKNIFRKHISDFLRINY